MSIKLVSHEDNKAKFNVVVEGADFEKAVQESYLKNRKSINIPGFRKGKAPRKIIEANYGKEVFYGDAIDKLMQESYIKGIEELELEPISAPSGDMEEIEEGKDLTFMFEVETKPEPEIGDYSKIEVVKNEMTLAENDVDLYIEREREKNKVIKNVEDRPAKEGDVANIDYEGFKDGEAFEGGKAEGYDLKLGSKSFIPGFEEEVIGKNVGDEFEINLSFPEDYHVEDLKGQPVVFKVKINELKEEILPEIDDDFAMDVSDFDTLEEYKKDIEAKLQKELDDQNRIQLENDVIAKLIEENDIPAPESMVESRIDQEVHEYSHNLQHMGFTMESFMNATQATEEDIREQFREKSVKNVQAQILLDAIVKKENIDVSDEDVEAEYKDIVKQYGQEDSEEFLETVKKSISVDYIKDIIRKRKVVDKLIANAVFVEKPEEEVEEAEETEEDKENQEGEE